MSAPPASRPPVVIAYDGSHEARRAIEVAASLLPGRRALVLCIWSTPRELEAVYGLAATMLYGDDRDTLRRARAIAADGCRAARQAGLDAVAITAHAGTGEVWRRIGELAREREADLVVTGSRRRGELGALVLGSVSRGLLEHADVPVLVVPPASEGDPAAFPARSCACTPMARPPAVRRVAETTGDRDADR